MDRNDGRSLTPRNDPPVNPGADPPGPWRGYQAGPPDAFRYGESYMVVEEEVSYRHYLDFLLRRKWTIAAATTVCLVTALIYSLAATPTYRSRTVLQIQPNGPNIVDFASSIQQSINQVQAYKDFFQTQYSVLSSRALASRTVDALRLAEEPLFNPQLKEKGALGSFKEWLVALLPDDSADEQVDEKTAAEREHKMLVDLLLSNVIVSPKEESYLVEVAYIAEDPKLAQRIVSTMAKQYVELTMDQSIGSAATAKDFIEQQLTVTKSRLEESEVALQAFAKGKDIYAIEEEDKVLRDRLDDLSKRVTEAEAERIRLEAEHLQVQGPMRASMPGIIDNPLLKTLKDQLSEAEAELALLRQTFSNEFPDVRSMAAKVASLQKQLKETEQGLVNSVASAYQTAVQREKDLRKTLDEHQAAVADFEAKSVMFNIMKRDIDTNRQLYENLLSRYKEIEVAGAMRASNITVLDQAEVPLKHHRPLLALNLALALVVGLFGGVGVAVSQEYLDDTVKSPEDVERAARLATLAAVPVFAAPEDTAAMTTYSPDRQVAVLPTSAGAEAVRTLRASLMLAASGGLPTRLLVTSSAPGEGKTCLTTNLALAFAQMGKRVMLMDCDLRKPRVHNALGLDNAAGTSSYLTGNAQLADIIRESGHPGLHVITGGPPAPNPVDLLGSPLLAELLDELEARYDLILLDAPPTLGFADVPTLANRAGGACLLVAQAGSTPRHVLKHASEYLLRMQSKVLGVVLNKVSTRGSSYSYYGGYYGYGYGSHYGVPYSSADQAKVGRLGSGTSA
ncbi:MAG TPA: polysaccharide biosynthesis tyrosine autokinase [Candidatus Limnocylindrales bacterium]|nr:polysaccharide biosynthesis tyrosine autokinase [Candidatus Limnocylindrales bacterium]